MSAYRELSTRPDFGDIEGVKAKLIWIRLLWLHDLHFGSPLNLATGLNDVPQLHLRIVGVLTRNANGLWLGELLLAVLGEEVVLDVHELAGLVYPLEGVAAVAVLVDPSVWRAVIREEHQTSVVALRRAAEQVEGRVVVKEEVLRVAGLRADDVWPLDRVAAEEDREVQADDVVVSYWIPLDLIP